MDRALRSARRTARGYGAEAFSPAAFERQLAAPGAVLLLAFYERDVVGAHIWYVDGEVGYSHLAATSERGYESGASYALHWAAIEHFRERVRWLDLGAGAGAEGERGTGLSGFKRGFATESRIAYFCGRICDRPRYGQLIGVRRAASTYFPAYRDGELA